MDEPRMQKFLIVEDDAKYAAWLHHAVGAGWPNDSVVIMDWTSFGRVHTAMSARDYDVVMLSLSFDEGVEEPTTNGFEWIRKLRTQAGFPEIFVLAAGGSELAAVRSLRLGAADYLPKRLLTPPRLHRSIKLTLRMIEKEAQRRAERAAREPPKTRSLEKADKVENIDRADMSMPAARVAPTHISTHTGASLARAAEFATAPPSGSKPVHVATHTGASLAIAARAALAAHPSAPAPAPAPVPTKVNASVRDAAAQSFPAMAAAVARDSKQIAPESHQIPGYTILQKIGE